MPTLIRNTTCSLCFERGDLVAVLRRYTSPVDGAERLYEYRRFYHCEDGGLQVCHLCGSGRLLQ